MRLKWLRALLLILIIAALVAGWGGKQNKNPVSPDQEKRLRVSSMFLG